jgi:hypothetical protein
VIDLEPLCERMLVAVLNLITVVPKWVFKSESITRKMSATTSPQAAAARLKRVSKMRPTLAMVLGSGFHHVLTELEVDQKVLYTQIPGFPKPTVKGHAGELYFGKLGGVPVLILSGRAHFYEGHSMERVTFAIRALAAFGIRDLLLTNAAGGINQQFIARRGHAGPDTVCGYDACLRPNIESYFVSGWERR